MELFAALEDLLQLGDPFLVSVMAGREFADKLILLDEKRIFQHDLSLSPFVLFPESRQTVF